jgi:uncharacterized protein (DUF849 family)
MINDLIINFTPTGMIPTKAMTPFVPISVSEIIEDVHEAWEIGITMVHLHARDPVTGDPTYKTKIYGEIISGIRKFAENLIICVSLSGRNYKEIEKRAAPLELKGHLKPDMGSLTLSSLNFNKQASISEPEIIKALAHIMKEKEVAPELEVFDVGMINYARYLQKKKLIAPPYYFNLMFGNVACAQPDPLHVGVMIRDLPDRSYWSIAGIGNYQMMMNSMSIAVGGGVRVGLEDNIWFDRKRTTLARNADLLKRIHTLAEANERMLMPASELRKKLRLQKGSNGHYGLKTNQSLQ